MSTALQDTPTRIDVLVVEDSPTMRQLLVHILTTDPLLHVIGTAADGEEAIALINAKKPHVITMDLHMPRMGGIEAVRIIMETMPTPIVIVSADVGSATQQQVFVALTVGAVAIVEKPTGLLGSRAEVLARNLVQTVKLMAEVKVVRRWPKMLGAQSAAPLPSLLLRRERSAIELIAIGASTGGPLVLQELLSGLAGKLSVPVVIVQHIASGFTEGFADWLGASSGLPVHVAVAGQRLTAGHAYIAPDGLQMGIAAGPRITLAPAPAENGHRPSVSHFFRATVNVLGRRAIGVLLSGMGKDGAYELKLLADSGAITIAQDPLSAVVASMPGEAIKLGGAVYTLMPDKMAAMVLQLLAARNTETIAPPVID